MQRNSIGSTVSHEEKHCEACNQTEVNRRCDIATTEGRNYIIVPQSVACHSVAPAHSGAAPRSASKHPLPFRE